MKISMCKSAAFTFCNANISHIVESDIYGTSATEGVIAL